MNTMVRDQTRATARYTYRAARADGALELGALAAENRDAAARLLAERGLFPIVLTLEREDGGGTRRLSARELALGFRVLATLLGAGLSMSRALAALPELAPPAWRSSLPAIQRAITEGASLGGALATSGLAVPPVVLGMLQAGEAGSGVALAALVRESTRRFFIQNGAPLVTSRTRFVGPGTVWGAAFEAPLIAAVEHACRAAHLRVAAIVPTVVALGRALEGEFILWRDGDVRTTITVDHGTIGSIRCAPSDEAEASADITATPVPPLALLGERAIEFADAYGATQVPRAEPLALRAGDALSYHTPSRPRLIVAACAVVLASAWALAGPALIATRAAHQAAARLAIIAPAERRARATEEDLRRVTSALREVTAFEASRRSATQLLAQLTRALPDSSALVALRIDTAGATLVALAARASQVVDALEHVPGLARPEITGPVTRESDSGRDVERVTIRFRLAAVPTAPPSSFTRPAREVRR